MKLYCALLFIPIFTMTCAQSEAAQVTRAANVDHSVTSGLERTINDLLSSSSDVRWISYEVPSSEPHAYVCCFSSMDDGEKHHWKGGSCTLEGGASFFSSNHSDSNAVVLDPNGERLRIFLRVTDHRIDKVKMFSSDCHIDTGSASITPLSNVVPEESVAMLEKLLDTIDAGGQRDKKGKEQSTHLIPAIGSHSASNTVDTLARIVRSKRSEDIRAHAAFWLGMRGGAAGRQVLQEMLESPLSEHLQDQAVAGIAQDESRAAIDLLLKLARTHRDPQVRKHAIFWLGQKAGEQATKDLKDAADDPDEDVQEMAVFSISQLPKDRAIPELISLARTHKSKAVREKAIFWLGQSGDERALDFIEEVLTK